jgi:hypothetical protein
MKIGALLAQKKSTNFIYCGSTVLSGVGIGVVMLPYDI